MSATPASATWRSRFGDLFRVEPKSSRRDARVDTMRGVFLALMIVDHIGGFWARWVTWQPLGLVSAAEGFVFLSGCVFAHVQQRKGTELSGLRQRSWARAREIYIWYLGVVAVLLVLPPFGWWLHTGLTEGDWGRWQSRAWKIVVEGQGNWRTLLSPLLLLRLNNILVLYVVLLLAAPFVLKAMQTTRCLWLSLAGSVALWWIGLHVDLQRHVGSAILREPWHESSFPVLSWQLYFVTGLACGVRWGRGIVPGWMRSRAFVTAVIVFAVYVFLQRHAMIRGNYALGWQFWPWADGQTPGPGGMLRHWLSLPGNFLGEWIWDNDHRRHAHPLRVVDALALALLLKLAWERVPTTHGIGWLALMGRHSLAVYAIQEVVLSIIAPWKPWFKDAQQPWIDPALHPWLVQLPILVVLLAFYVGVAALMERRKRPGGVKPKAG